MGMSERSQGKGIEWNDHGVLGQRDYFQLICPWWLVGLKLEDVRVYGYFDNQHCRGGSSPLFDLVRSEKEPVKLTSVRLLRFILELLRLRFLLGSGVLPFVSSAGCRDDGDFCLFRTCGLGRPDVYSQVAGLTSRNHSGRMSPRNEDSDGHILEGIEVIVGLQFLGWLFSYFGYEPPCYHLVYKTEI